MLPTRHPKTLPVYNAKTAAVFRPGPFAKPQVHSVMFSSMSMFDGIFHLYQTLVMPWHAI